MLTNDPFKPSQPANPSSEPIPEFERSTEPVSLVERQERLSRMISTKTMQGFQVVDRNEQQASAVLMKPAVPVNHILHLLITTLTCGLWLLVWIFLVAKQQKEERIRLTIDQYGSLIEETVKI